MPANHLCRSCSKTFSSLAGVKAHAKATGHNCDVLVCEEHELSFESSDAFETHTSSSIHQDGLNDNVSPVAFSSLCYNTNYNYPFWDGYLLNNMVFYQRLALSRMQWTMYQQYIFSLLQNWCFECSRGFNSQRCLQHHQNSLAHTGRHLQCPFCDRMFKTISGIAQHVESGCDTFTRHQVTAAVHKMKIAQIISIKQIEGNTSRPHPPSQAAFTYPGPLFTGTNTLNRCPFALCDKSFKTWSALASHLDSPAHDADEFRCPDCKTDFKLVSGFLQHFESKCCGLAENVEVKSRVKNLTGQFSRLLRN